MSAMGLVTTLPSAVNTSSLSLDFVNQAYVVNGVNKSFNDLITFARTSTATYFDSDGLLKTAPINTPRFDYNPVTKAAKGLLIEDARTNLMTNSSRLTEGYWSNGGSGTLNLLRQDYASSGPRGPMTMTWIARQDTAIKYMSRGVTGTTTNQTVTLSMYAKAGTVGNYLAVRLQATFPARVDTVFDLVNGTVYSNNAYTDVTASNATITPVGGGVYRCTITATSGATALQSVLFAPRVSAGQIDSSDTGLANCYVDAVQFEIGAFATSYIPSTDTFTSRASVATYYDSKGVLKTAASGVGRTDAYTYDSAGVLRSTGLLLETATTNLLPNSHYFNNSSTWARNTSNTTVNPNTALAPDGTLTADTIVDSGNGDDFIFRNTAIPNDNTKYTYSAYVRKTVGATTTVCLWLLLTGGVDVSRKVVLDTNTGTSFSPATPLSVVQSCGDYWRVSTAYVNDTSGHINAQVRFYPAYNLVSDANETRRNESTGNAVIWGAQLETGDISTYIPSVDTFTSRSSTATYIDSTGTVQTAAANSARTNAYEYDANGTLQPIGLLLEGASTNLLKTTGPILRAGGVWGAYQGAGSTTTVEQYAGLAPDGTFTACKLSFIGSTNLLTQNVTVTASATYTLSAWMKGTVGGEKVRLDLRNTSSVGVAGALFTLTTKWQRYSVTVTSDAATDRGFQFRSITGDGDSVFYTWGTQLEAGYESSHIPSIEAWTSRASTATYWDNNGVLKTAASGVARSAAYMFNDAGVPQYAGLLLEAAATNVVPYSNEFTNAAWTKGGGVTLSTDGTTAPDGTIATKVTVTGTTAHDISIPISALTVGADYTFSVWINSATAVPGFQLAYYDGGTQVAGNTVSIPIAGWTRYSVTFNPSSVPTSPRARLLGYSGGKDGAVFYMFGAQLEFGTQPTSYIATGATSATRATDVYTSTAQSRTADVSTSTNGARAADVSSSTTTVRGADSAGVYDVTGWYNALEGTLASTFSSLGTGAQMGVYRRPASLGGTGSNEIGMYCSSSVGNMFGYLYNGSTQMEVASGVALTAGEVRSAAIAYKLNNSTFASKGNVAATDTACTIPSIASLRIGGKAASAGDIWFGNIQQVTYYPRRLSNVLTQINTDT